MCTDIVISGMIQTGQIVTKLTLDGGCPPMVFVLNTWSAILPPLSCPMFATFSQAMSVVLFGAGTLFTPLPTKTA